MYARSWHVHSYRTQNSSTALFIHFTIASLSSSGLALHAFLARFCHFVQGQPPFLLPSTSASYTLLVNRCPISSTYLDHFKTSLSTFSPIFSLTDFATHLLIPAPIHPDDSGNTSFPLHLACVSHSSSYPKSPLRMSPSVLPLLSSSHPNLHSSHCTEVYVRVFLTHCKGRKAFEFSLQCFRCLFYYFLSFKLLPSFM